MTATPGSGPYHADIRSYNHPYPFGMPQPGRSWDSVLYRYGFNGMETDPEIKEGRDQHYTTFFRQYDPRLGRWWSHDPVKQMGESPYAAMFNNPVLFGDPLGSDPETGGGSGTEAGPVDGGGGTGGGNGGGSTGGLIPLLDGYVDRQIFGPSGRPKQGDGTRTSDGMFIAHSPTTGEGTGTARGTQQSIPPPPVANALPADFVPPAGESLGPADVEPSDWQKGVDLVDRTLHDPIVSQSFPFIGAGAVLFDIVDDGVGAATTLYSTHVSGGTTFPRGLNGESLDGKEQKEVLLHTYQNVVVVGTSVAQVRNIRTLAAIAEAEKNTVYLFRGTSEGWQGNPGTLRTGVTPVTKDPFAGTVFATESNQVGRGVLQVFTPEDLVGLEIVEGNWLRGIEVEFGVVTTPLELASRASTTISVSQARSILLDMGIDVPSVVYGKEGIDYYLKNSSKMSKSQITEFISRIK